MELEEQNVEEQVPPPQQAQVSLSQQVVASPPPQQVTPLNNIAPPPQQNIAMAVPQQPTANMEQIVQEVLSRLGQADNGALSLNNGRGSINNPGDNVVVTTTSSPTSVAFGGARPRTVQSTGGESSFFS